MPLPLSSIAITEKNKIATDSIWYLAVKITIPGVSEPVRVVQNNENIVWPTGSGTTWVAFPFELEEIGEESKGEVPEVVLRVSNVSRQMEAYLQDFDAYTKANGYSTIEFEIYVLNSKNLASSTPECVHYFELIQPKTDAMWATFRLGAANPFQKRFPKHRMTKNHCLSRYNYPVGTSVICGAPSSSYTTCDKTLTACRQRNNSTRFRGFPGIGAGGIRLA